MTLLVKFWRNVHSHTLVVGHDSHGGPWAVPIKIRNVYTLRPLGPSSAPRDLASQYIYTHTRETINAKVYSLLIEIAKDWKEPKYPSIRDWFSYTTSTHAWMGGILWRCKNGLGVLCDLVWRYHKSQSGGKGTWYATICVRKKSIQILWEDKQIFENGEYLLWVRSGLSILF